MLIFSESGLKELWQLTLEIEPYISREVYSQLFSLVNSIGQNRAIQEKNYNMLTEIIRQCLSFSSPMTFQADFTTTECSNQCENTLSSRREAIMQDYYFFLVAYLGIAKSTASITPTFKRDNISRFI